MIRRGYIVVGVLVLALAMAVPAFANRGDGALGTVYVESQGLYYDTFVTVDSLVFTGTNGGSFQLLANGATAYGPGDPGYRGGRWWIDNGNGYPDAGDTFVLCPLLGPGRTEP
jgi:hypothetical protein